MPNYHDPFTLVVRGSAEARVDSNNASAGSGSQFIMTFHYAGGFNPTATGFEVHWFTNETQADEQGLKGNWDNALSSGDSRIPTQINITPSIPEPGAETTSPGELTATAPTLAQNVEELTLYGVLTILQGNLNS